MNHGFRKQTTHGPIVVLGCRYPWAEEFFTMASPASPVSPSSAFGPSLHQRPFPTTLQGRLRSFSKSGTGDDNTLPYSLRIFRSLSISPTVGTPREEKVEQPGTQTEVTLEGAYSFHSKLSRFYASPRLGTKAGKAIGGYEFHDKLYQFYNVESPSQEQTRGGYEFHDRLSQFYSVDPPSQEQREGGYEFLQKLSSIYAMPSLSSKKPEGGYELLSKLSTFYDTDSASSQPEGGYDFLTKLSDFYESNKQLEGSYDFLTELSSFYGTTSSKQLTSTSLSYKSSTLPFGRGIKLSAIKGHVYLTSQVLVQQVAYTLSDKIFAYSPESFDLDLALQHWSEEKENNAFGFIPGVQNLETRAGAGAIALGYMFSPDFDLEKRNIPQTVVASSASLAYMRQSLDQLSLLHALSNPFVAHVAAVDYIGSGLVTDYLSSLTIADELGLGLVASASAEETQHMSLFATLLAKIVPSIHTYDGVTVSRQTARFNNVLEPETLHRVYNNVTRALFRESLTKYTTNDGRLIRLLQAFNTELGTDYELFEYSGHSSPQSVLVVFGTVEASLSKKVAQELSKNGEKIGVVNVRVYRPFVEDEFLKALPRSVKRVGVLGQVDSQLAAQDKDQHSALYQDVFAALTFLWGRRVAVRDLKYTKHEAWTSSKVLTQFEKLTDKEIPFQEPTENVDARSYRFWDTEDSSSVEAAFALGQILSSEIDNHVSTATSRDALVQGGTVRTDIWEVDSSSIPPAVSPPADLVVVGDEKILNEFDILTSLKAGGSLLLKLPGAKNEDLEKKIQGKLRQGIASRAIKLFILDPSASEIVSKDSTQESLLVQVAFLHLTGWDLPYTGLDKITAVNGDEAGVRALARNLDKVLRQFDVPESWAAVEVEVEKVSLPSEISLNSFSRIERIDPEPLSELSNWTEVAKSLAFKEAYGATTALRPDLGIKTCVVRVKEHRRLTPLNYDRNIFHIEFDLGDSGLTYSIGEALGIHAENDATEVEEFIKWYKLNPSDVVSVPSRENPEVFESRTVFQSLMQNIDLFGRPPKRFYEALSEFATVESHKKSLLALAGPEGAMEFKRRAEVDTITFADVLQEFPSAHPPFPDLARIVSPMKRREYSIASSQHAQPTSVSLLIVTVGWVDPRGRDRFGQATRFLNGLPLGAPVTVSVKPSVMKLPPKTTAPVIMAGLGTGLAPFRAFVQERAYQRDALGLPIGPVMLYLGSRHQREEYLYGEEWEAYLDAGVMTHLGAAFSRDQSFKIYIQDRMRQSMDELRDKYLRQEGAFYLCGPTWPVPDVTQVLQEVVEREEMSKGKEKKKIDSRRAIETLKEEGRYVLEVY